MSNKLWKIDNFLYNRYTLLALDISSEIEFILQLHITLDA